MNMKISSNNTVRLPSSVTQHPSCILLFPSKVRNCRWWEDGAHYELLGRMQSAIKYVHVLYNHLKKHGTFPQH
jgi:hypothetical protein